MYSDHSADCCFICMAVRLRFWNNRRLKTERNTRANQYYLFSITPLSVYVGVSNLNYSARPLHSLSPLMDQSLYLSLMSG